MTTPPPAPPALGRRALNKQGKLERIAEAAEALLSSQDYDATTMGEVARRAGVATGTLFIYADSKRDLVFLIANGWFEAAVEQAEAVPTALPLLEQLVRCLAPFYELYRSRPRLAPILLREILFFDGRHAVRSRAAIDRVRRTIAARVAAAAPGMDTADAADAAQVVYAVYQIEVRRWVSEGAFDVPAGLGRLRRLLQVALRGASPRQAGV